MNIYIYKINWKIIMIKLYFPNIIITIKLYFLKIILSNYNFYNVTICILLSMISSGTTKCHFTKNIVKIERFLYLNVAQSIFLFHAFIMTIIKTLGKTVRSKKCKEENALRKVYKEVK